MSSGAIGAVHTVAGLRDTSGGMSRSIPMLCGALARCEVRTVLVSQAIDDAMSPLLVPDPALVKSILVPGFDWPHLRASFTPGLRSALEKACRDNLPCVVHDHGVWLHMNHVVASTARRMDLRRIVSPRGMLEGWSLGYRKMKKRFAWLAYQRRDLETVDAFCATSEAEAEAINALSLGRPIAVIPNGVDVPVARSTQSQRRDKRRVVFMSRIHPKKGLLDLVSAWARTPRGGWDLTIAGPDEGGHRREVEAAALRAGVAQEIVFTGAVQGSDKEQLLQSADVFVLPSYSENFGMAIAEALAAGVPVITTRATPWQELHTHGCGWWVDNGIEPLTAALSAAIALPDSERAAMGARGADLVKQKYSWASVAERHVELYRWVIASGPRPAFVLQ